MGPTGAEGVIGMRARVVARGTSYVRRRTLTTALVVAAAALLGAVLLVSAASASGRQARSGLRLTPAMAHQLSQNVNQKVVVIMQKQVKQARVGTRAAKLRARSVMAKQVPLMNQLQQVHATHVQRF